MATAVIDLGFDLKTKLAWMIYEDTNLELVGRRDPEHARRRAASGRGLRRSSGALAR